MDDKRFEEEITKICYDVQITGYPEGHPGRINFKPIVPIMYDSLGVKINRGKTLELPAYYCISDELKKELLSYEI